MKQAVRFLLDWAWTLCRVVRSGTGAGPVCCSTVEVWYNFPAQCSVCRKRRSLERMDRYCDIERMLGSSVPVQGRFAQGSTAVDIYFPLGSWKEKVCETFKSASTTDKVISKRLITAKALFFKEAVCMQWLNSIRDCTEKGVTKIVGK